MGALGCCGYGFFVFGGFVLLLIGAIAALHWREERRKRRAMQRCGAPDLDEQQARDEDAGAGRPPGTR